MSAMWWLGLLLLALATFYTGYLVLITAAALGSRLSRRPCRSLPQTCQHRFAFVVPAHNEAAMLPGLFVNLATLHYPRERYEVVIVADNCDDDTAAIGVTHGGRVLTRTDPVGRGKGHALAWALPRLVEEGRHDAFVVLDADSRVAPLLLQKFDAVLSAGAVVAQAHCVVGNAEQSWRTALMAADMSLIKFLRPSGRQALGASADLQGNGICLTRTVLQQVPWDTVSVAEDHEYHIRLLLEGFRSVFVPDAVVYVLMEPTLATAREQELRWESGRLTLAQRYVGALLRAAWRHRGGGWRPYAGAVLDLITPPLALLVAGTAAMTVVHTLLWFAGGLRWPAALWGAMLTGQAWYIFTGCALVGVRWRAYAALFLYGPVYAAAKIGYCLAVARRPSREWMPTMRGSASWTTPEHAAHSPSTAVPPGRGRSPA